MAQQTVEQLAPEHQLARGTLTLPDAIAISVSVIAPGMAAFLNVPGVAVQAGDPAEQEGERRGTSGRLRPPRRR